MTAQIDPERERTVAAVCGLFCEACTLYIATKEDPERLKALAQRFGMPPEDMKCHGCRSDIRGPYCQTMCKMSPCAAEKGVDFCSECAEYPCGDLEEFQSLAPHRIELWDDLAFIKDNGYKAWLEEARKKYSCPECGVINSAYDLACRKCGREPGSEYARLHRQAIEEAMKNF